MPRLTIACLFGLLPLTTGCTVIKQINDNLHYEKQLYHSVQRKEADVEKDSEELLKIIAGKHPHREFSRDFRDGFKDGYRDFLVYGGPVRPPAMPPTKYRTAKYLTPHGHCQVRDYFLGFQYGAEVADSTGRRQFFTLPILVTDQGPPPPLDIVVLPPLPDENADPTKPKTEAPMPATPAPRKIETPATMPEKSIPVPDKSVPPAPAPVPEKSTPPVEPPKTVPTPKPPMPMTPPMTTPTAPVPMPTPTPVPTPKPEPKYDPIPKPVDPPKVDPPKTTTQAIPIPTPMPSVPAVPASTGPAPIPLIPVMPSVSLGPVIDPAVVPVSGTSK